MPALKEKNMHTIKTVIISAAGMGTRLGLQQPKCLVCVGNRPIIHYQLDLLHDVADVRIVVGYKKNRVIDYASRFRPDINFVHNDRYARTSTLQSFWLAARDLTEPFLILDGDVIIEPESFAAFCSQINFSEPLIGITPANTEDAVFVRLAASGSAAGELAGFQRRPRAAYEWTGVAHLLPGMLTNENTYVFQCLEKYLPLRTAVINCLEIDTPRDLLFAENILQAHWQGTLSGKEPVPLLQHFLPA